MRLDMLLSDLKSTHRVLAGQDNDAARGRVSLCITRANEPETIPDSLA